MGADRKALSGEVITKKPKTKKSKAVIKADTSIIAGVTTKELEAALKVQSKQRELIKDFVQSHLVEGVDYGTISGESSSGRKFQSGATLFKPGQEKIFSLFKLTSKLSKDEETLDMAGNLPGLIAFKCDVYRDGQWITEGRGAATIGENRRDANSTIKIAEKRARMDACLALGFSEYFTQDLEDPEYKKNAEEAARRKAEEYDRLNPFGLPERKRTAPANDPERKILAGLMLKRGITTKEEQMAVLIANGVDDPKGMNSGQIRDFINKIKTNAFDKPPAKPDTVIDDIGDGTIGLDDIPDTEDQTPVTNLKADLVVDQDLINNVQENFAIIDLNTRGKQWFMRTVKGTPFKPVFADFNDADWRKAYEVVNDILDNNIDIPDHYFGNSNGGQRPMNFSESSRENQDSETEDSNLKGDLGDGVSDTQSNRVEG